MLNPFNSEPLLSISDIIALGGFIVASLSFLLAFLSFKQSKKAAEPQVIIYTDHFYTETADGESLYLKNYIIIQNYGSVSATITNVTYDNANLVNEHLPILTNLKGITLAPNQSIKSEFFYNALTYLYTEQSNTHGRNNGRLTVPNLLLILKLLNLLRHQLDVSQKVRRFHILPLINQLNKKLRP